MFSKKISNDENNPSLKTRTCKIDKNKNTKSKNGNFLSSIRSASETANKKHQIWLNANKSWYKKYKIIIGIISFFCMGSAVAMIITGEVQKSQYKINYDQNLTLKYLSRYAKKAIPLFKEYTSVPPPAPILPSTVSAIDNITVYLKKFQYISDLSDTEFTIINFNVWVQRYQQWPQQLNDATVLETKDKYVATLNTLVTEMTTRKNPDIPLAEMNSMSDFAHTLKEIDMNIYASVSWYKNAQNLALYSMIPMWVSVLVLIFMSYWMYDKQKKWFRQHGAELNAHEEIIAK